MEQQTWMTDAGSSSVVETNLKVGKAGRGIGSWEVGVGIVKKVSLESNDRCDRVLEKGEMRVLVDEI